MLGEKIGSGYFSEVFDYGEGKVIKLMREGKPLEFAQREHDAIRAIHEKYEWAPAVYGIEQIGDRYGIVMEKAEGMPISDYLIRSSTTIKKYFTLMVDYQLKLHSIRNDTLPTYEEVLERNLEKLELPDKQKDFIREYARTLPYQSFICHGDFHSDNVIVSGDKIKVIDWSTAYRGNPLSDIVFLRLLLRMPIKHEKLKFPVNVIAVVTKVIIQKIYYKEYFKRTGATMQQMLQWLLPSAVIRLGEGVPGGEAYLYKIINKECERLGYTPG